MFRLSLLALGLSLFAFQPSFAQEPPQKGRTFRLACWSDWDGDELFIRLPKKGSQGDEEGKDGKMQKVEILDMNYSGPYAYTSGSPITLFKKSEDSDEPYAPVLKITIPGSVRDPLVFLQLSKDKIGHIIYDLDAKTFPYGSYKVVNFTTANLMAEFAGQRFGLKPRSTRLVNPGFKEKKPIQCKVAIEKDGKPKLVYSNMIMNRPKKRMLMFFYPTKDEAGRPTVNCRSLVDFKPAAKED